MQRLPSPFDTLRDPFGTADGGATPSGIALYAAGADTPVLVVDGYSDVAYQRDAPDTEDMAGLVVANHSRSGTATYFGADGAVDGRLLTAASGELIRRAQVPIDGLYSVAGLMLAGAITNLITQSDDVSGYRYAFTNYNANQSIGPAGVADVDRISSDTTASRIRGLDLPVNGNQFSAVVDYDDSASPIDHPTVSLIFPGGPSPRASFNFGPRTAGSDNGGVAELIDLGPGDRGRRLWIRGGRPGVGAVSFDMRFLFFSDTGPAGASVYISCVHVSTGDGLPAVIVPTTGSAATRNADDLTIPTTAFPYTSGDPGSMIVDCYVESVLTSGGEVIAEMTDGTEDNVVRIERTGSGGTFRAVVRAGGVEQASISGVVSADRGNYRCGVSWNGTEARFAVNGTEIGTEATGSVPTGLTGISFASDAVAPVHIGEARLFDTALSVSTLETETSAVLIETPPPEVP